MERILPNLTEKLDNGRNDWFVIILKIILYPVVKWKYNNVKLYILKTIYLKNLGEKNQII